MSAAFARIAACALAIAGCASDRAPGPRAPGAPPPPTPLIEWQASSGTIRCRSSQIVIPEALRGQVRWRTPHELALVPVRSPPGGALVVTLLEAVDDDGPFKFLEDSPRLWIDLHLLAVGGDLSPKGRDAGADGGAEEGLRVRGNFKEDGDRLIAEYDVGDQHGKAILLQVGRCRIRALDFPIPRTDLMLTDLVQRLADDANLDGPQ